MRRREVAGALRGPGCEDEDGAVSKGDEDDFGCAGGRGARTGARTAPERGESRERDGLTRAGPG